MRTTVNDRLLEDLKQFAELEQQREESLNRARQWSVAIIPYKDRLEQLIHTLDFDALPADWQNPLPEIEQDFKRLEHIPDLPQLSAPGWHLRNACWDVLSALRNASARKMDAAKASLKAAEIELGFFEIELFRQGITAA